MSYFRRADLERRPSFWLCFALILVLSWIGCAPHASDPSTEVVDALNTLKTAEGDAAVILSFAERAAAADVDSLIQMLDPGTRQLTGDPAIRAYLSSTVLPFFRGFKAVDTYETIAGAAFPDGRTGIVHYTYIMNQAEQRKPISIALVETKDGVRVVNVTVGQCVEGRHPKSEGRCDS